MVDVLVIVLLLVLKTAEMLRVHFITVFDVPVIIQRQFQQLAEDSGGAAGAVHLGGRTSL